MSKKLPQQPVPRNFEEAMGELEQILSDIENGQIGLEDSLLKYERGSFLLNHCREVLGKAEKQIDLLSKAANEQDGLVVEPLDEDAPSAPQ